MLGLLIFFLLPPGYFHNLPICPYFKRLQFCHISGDDFGTSQRNNRTFKNMCTAITADEATIIKPAEIKTPFTTEEIEKASKSMNNLERLRRRTKCSICKVWTSRNAQQNCGTTQHHSKNREIPCRNQSGILTPLPEPGKKQGPPANIRPIILLSIIRKILAICLIRRCWDRLSTRIPLANPLISLDEAQLNRCLPSKYSLKRPLHPARTISTYCY